MSSTNVNSSKTTVAFVICGANDKKLTITEVGKNKIGSEFKDFEAKVYNNTSKDLNKKRRTIPMSCEAKIEEMKAYLAGNKTGKKAAKKTTKTDINHEI